MSEQEWITHPEVALGQLRNGDGIELNGELKFVFDRDISFDTVGIQLSTGFWKDGEKLTHYEGDRHNTLVPLRHRVDTEVARALFEKIVDAAAAGGELQYAYREGLSEAFCLMVDETRDGLDESVETALKRRQEEG